MLFSRIICCLLLLALCRHLSSINNLHQMLKNEDKQVIMDLSGCTNIIAMFFESLHIYQNINYTTHIHEYRQKHFYKLYGYVTADEVASSNWYKFKVVRNPYSRAVSSYFHTMNLLWRSFFKHSNVFLSLVELNDNVLSISFEQFYKIYYDNYVTAIGYEPFHGHEYVSLQSGDVEWHLYEQNSSGSIYNRVIKIENLKNDILLINNETNMNYKLINYTMKSKRYNWASHDDTIILDTDEKLHYGQMTFKQFIVGKKVIYPQDYRVFYNDETKELLSKIFHKDLILYKYKFGDP